MSLCNRALGLQNGRIRNNQITASSEVNRFHAAWLGRLGRAKAGRYIGAWCPKHRNHNQWFKVDFRRLMKITKIATQGRHDAGHWVTSYYLSSSVDNVHWAIYRFRSANKVTSHTLVNGGNGYENCQRFLLYVLVVYIGGWPCRKPAKIQQVVMCARTTN